MARWPVKVEVAILLESTFQLIDELGSEHVTIGLSVFAPCAEEGRIREALVPIGFIGRQPLPVGRELVQQAARLVDLSEVE
jgi:hypothetical protein